MKTKPFIRPVLIATVILTISAYFLLRHSRDASKRDSTSSASPNGGIPSQPRVEIAAVTQAANGDSTSGVFIGERAIATMNEVEGHMANVLESANDDAAGRRSPWFPKLNAWHDLLRKAIGSRTRDDLFRLVPIAAEFYGRDREADVLSEPLDHLRFWMGHLGYDMITELGKIIAENDGALDNETVDIAVRLFAVDGIQSDPWPEDEVPPIDAAGILIARPDAERILNGLPVEQLGFFLRAETKENFFRRYDQNGDGMLVLRERYMENRALLNEIFSRLADKVAAHRSPAQ